MADINNKERILPGDTTVTQSTDEYIAGNLSQIQREINGVDNAVIDGDLYPTKLIGTETAVDHNDVDISTIPLPSVSNLKSSDSAFGIGVLRTRKKELKKAA